MTATTDHQEIKKWAEKFKGKPEIIPNSETETGAIGIRIDFPGKMDDTYLSDDHKPKHISWDEFFRIFEDEGLAMEYEDGNHFEDPSEAYRFILRNNLSLE
jgi:hypothetical protein